LIDSANTISARNPGNGNAITVLAGIKLLSNSVYQTFDVQEWCSSLNGGTSCPALTYTSTIEITKGLKNPPNAMFPSNSIKIEIYTSANDKIDAVTSNLLTIPSCNYGSLQSVSILRSSNVVGQITNLKFTFQTAANTAGALNNA
jgi:hypothetical protein